MYAPLLAYAFGQIRLDNNIDAAIRNGGSEIQNGIVKRIVDYNKEFQIFKYCDPSSEFRDKQICLMTLYLFSREVYGDLRYDNLREAVLLYDMKNNIKSDFDSIENCISVNNKGKIIFTPKSGGGIGCVFIFLFPIFPIVLYQFTNGILSI